MPLLIPVADWASTPWPQHSTDRRSISDASSLLNLRRMALATIHSNVVVHMRSWSTRTAPNTNSKYDTTNCGCIAGLGQARSSTTMQRTDVGVRLGARIRARRFALGLSQAALAEVVDLTPNYIGLLERGEALPTVQTLLVLGRALEATPTELLGEGTGDDEWLDRVIAVAGAVPPGQRELVLALMNTIVAQAKPAGRPAKRRRRG